MTAIAPARALVDRLVELGPHAHGALDLLLDELTVSELAALAFDWRGTWARPSQLIPTDGTWRSHGFLTARRFGKTRALAEFVAEEAASGRAMRIGLAAQNFEKTLEVMINGDCGLLACSPPWARARFEAGRVLWPNGAQAFPFSPEVPGTIRGPGVHLFWASEIQSWPAGTMEEAFSNASIMTSLGARPRFVWDATPRRRHPILRLLLAAAEVAPDLHRVVRGGIEENADNIGAGVISALRTQLGETRRAREELGGEFFDGDDDALFKSAWIDAARRDAPGSFARVVIGVDPALSDRRGTDPTGIVVVGVGKDGQAYVLADATARYSWEAWARVVLDLYTRYAADCVVVERNAGFDAVPANLRAAARDRGASVEIVAKDAVTRAGSTIYVKEILSTASKAARAEPIATAYEAGRVTHVRGADLAELEEELVSWSPSSGMRSPNRLDALVFAVWDLLGLSIEGGATPGQQALGIARRLREGALGSVGARVSPSTGLLLASDGANLAEADPRHPRHGRGRGRAMGGGDGWIGTGRSVI